MITERGGLPLVGFYFGSFDAVHWVATSHSVSIEQVIEQAAFFKIVVASTVFSGRLFLRLLFLLPLGVECHRSDRRPVACGA